MADWGWYFPLQAYLHGTHQRQLPSTFLPEKALKYPCCAGDFVAEDITFEIMAHGSVRNLL
jgi:hypothetical protein